MTVFVCTTCANVWEEDDLELDYEERYVCPEGHDHDVFTLEEVSDIVNAYNRENK